MQFTMTHYNFNVADVVKSIHFYEEAFGLKEVRRIPNDKFVIVFMGDGVSNFRLELTQMFDHPKKYELGENETHLGFVSDDFEGAHARHKAMGIIVYENPKMGIYFVEDPDGYWLEVVPNRK